MPLSSNILSCILILSFLLLLLVVVESQNDTSFEIDVFTPHSLLLTYERDAHVPPDKGFVRLAPPYNATGSTTKAGFGRVLYTAPVNLWVPYRPGEKAKQSSFETTITQRTTRSSNNTNTLYGWTFFIIPVNSTTNNAQSGGGNMGIYEALTPGSPFVTIEFDLAVALLYDPEYTHIGININSMRSQNHTRFQNWAGELLTARITYDAPTRLISVNATYGSTTSLVSFHYNLRDLLPDQVQVGLSAATESSASGAAGNFDVYTWHFNSTMGPDSNRIIQDDSTPTDIKKFIM